MALTLAEATKLSNDILLKGVIDTVINESPILRILPFAEIVGNALTYNRVNAYPTVAFYDVGDTWSEGAPTFTQVTATLKICGGDADVDNYIKKTRSNVQDAEAAVIGLKSQALANKFDDTFINGDTSSDAKAFNGISKSCAAGQMLTMGADGGTLTLAKVDELTDKIKPGRADCLLMSRRSRRKIRSLARAAGTNLTIGRGILGEQLEYWGDIPIYINDYISDAQTVGINADCSVIFALRFGEGHLAGLSAPGLLEVERIGSLETKDATRTRVKWYCSLALFSELSLAKLIGVRD
ncbi:MAG: phage major capsid protein [Chloroflexi bacterium]|nr:phage major capsid protein [Chloroflexota bacterium]